MLCSHQPWQATVGKGQGKVMVSPGSAFCAGVRILMLVFILLFCKL